MKKVLLTILALFVTVGISYATITVEQARSKEQLKKEGYSSPLIEVVQKESGEYNPKPTNKWQKFGFKFWNYVDPASPQARDEERHDIKFYPTYSDL